LDKIGRIKQQEGYGMKKFTSKMPKVFLMVVAVTGAVILHTYFMQADNPLLRKVEETRESIQAENWETAKANAIQLKDLYEKKRWVMELFGPFEHVSDTRTEIYAFVKTTELEEKGDALTSLERIDARLDEFVIF
jgi:hypothetical protein